MIPLLTSAAACDSSLVRQLRQLSKLGEAGDTVAQTAAVTLRCDVS